MCSRTSLRAGWRVAFVLALAVPACTHVYGESFSFAVVADPHIDGHADHEAAFQKALDWIVDNASSTGIELVFVVGDLAWGSCSEAACLERAKAMLDGLSGAGLLYVPLIGDNEVHTGCSEEFEQVFSPQYALLATAVANWQKAPVPIGELYLQNMSFDYKGCHFVCADLISRVPGEDAGELHDFEGGTWPWFVSDIENCAKPRQENILMMTHIGMFQTGMPVIDQYLYSEEEMAQITEFLAGYEAYVAANYAGHIHQNWEWVVYADTVPLYAVWITDETWYDTRMPEVDDQQTTVRWVHAEDDGAAFSYTQHVVAVEGEGEGEGEVGEEIDFCTAFGQVSTNVLIGQVGEEYSDLLALLDPVVADINGSFYVDISDPQNHVIDVVGNGLLDAGSELGLLARILAEPGFDNGVLTHGQVRAAWEHNWDQLLYGNIGPVLAPALPALVPGLMEILDGYITLGDGDLTSAGYLMAAGDGSFGIIAGLFALLDDALEDYFGSGFADPVLDKADFVVLDALWPTGDADGDGHTNVAEYLYFTPVVCAGPAKSDPGIDYVTAVLNPRICPDCPECPECTPTARRFFEVGEDACLTVPGDVSPEAVFVWSKAGEGALAEGRYLGVACKTLLIPNLQLADSGTYVCEYEGEKGTYTVDIAVAEEVPAGGTTSIVTLISLLSAIAVPLLLPRRRNQFPFRLKRRSGL